MVCFSSNSKKRQNVILKEEDFNKHKPFLGFNLEHPQGVVYIMSIRLCPIKRDYDKLPAQKMSTISGPNIRHDDHEDWEEKDR